MMFKRYRPQTEMSKEVTDDNQMQQFLKYKQLIETSSINLNSTMQEVDQIIDLINFKKVQIPEESMKSFLQMISSSFKTIIQLQQDLSFLSNNLSDCLKEQDETSEMTIKPASKDQL